MASARDLYEVLGVRPDAPPEEVKRQYRQLAREYHPDVAKVDQAATRFKEINEAHHILGDAERRATYDAERKLSEERRESRRRAAERPSEPRNGPTSSGSGRTRAEAPHAAGPRPPGGRPAAARAAASGPQVAQWLAGEGRAAFKRMRYREAEEYCRQAIRLDRGNAGAYEVLGDIHRSRGRVDEALAMYTYAVQLDKTNRTLQAKVERLVRHPHGDARHPNAGLDKVLFARAVLLGAGAALIGVLVLIVNQHHPVLVEAQLAAMAAAGGVAGMFGSLTGCLGAPRDELVLRPSGRRKRPIPLGLIVGVLSGVWLWPVAALYLIQAKVTGVASRSLLAAVSVSLLIAILFNGVGQGNSPTWLFSGNVVLPACLVGWILADRARQ